MTDVSQVISGKKIFSVRFQDGCENDLISNRLTIVVVENIPVEKEPEVTTNTEIPEEKVTS